MEKKSVLKYSQDYNRKHESQFKKKKCPVQLCPNQMNLLKQSTKNNCYHLIFHSLKISIGSPVVYTWLPPHKDYTPILEAFVLLFLSPKTWQSIGVVPSHLRKVFSKSMICRNEGTCLCPNMGTAALEGDKQDCTAHSPQKAVSLQTIYVPVLKSAEIP